MERYKKEFLILAHDKSIYHETRIIKSTICGCFHCEKTFKPERIEKWTDEDSKIGRTAECPYCGIDSVIGDDFPVYNKEFLSQMNKLWFQNSNLD